MLRLSDGSGELKGRWDANFIDTTLNEVEKDHGLNLKKIWVCGPPVMNTTWEERTKQADFKNLAWSNKLEII